MIYKEITQEINTNNINENNYYFHINPSSLDGQLETHARELKGFVGSQLFPLWCRCCHQHIN